MKITHEQAKRFLDDFESSDLIAIQNMKRAISKNSKLHIYLEALEKLNEIMIGMEEGNIEYDINFNNLYRDAMSLLYTECQQIKGGK